MSSFLGNTLRLGGGDAAAQCLALALYPVLTRLYQPADFGAFGYVSSLVMILGPVAALRYNQALLLPERHADAAGLRRLCLWLVAGFCAGLALLPALAAGTPLSLPAPPGFDPALYWFVPFGVAGFGIHQTMIFWGIRHKAFSGLAVARILLSAADRAGSIALYALGPAGLLLGRWLSPWPAAALIWLRTRSRTGAAPGAPLVRLAVRYKDFALFGSPGFLLSAASLELPTILFLALYSPAAAGFYALTARVLFTPMHLVGDAVSKVFLQQAVELRDKPEELSALVRSLAGYASLVFVPPLLLLALAGPYLFGLVFGEQWREAGRFAALLSPSFFFLLVYRPLSAYFVAFERQRAMLGVNAALLAARTGAMAAAWAATSDALPAAGALSGATSACFLGAILWLGAKMHVSPAELTRELFLRGRVVLPAAAVAGIVLALGPGGAAVIGVAITLAITYLVLVLRDDTARAALQRLGGRRG